MEHDIQVAFIDWVKRAERTDKRLQLLFAVPNGGQRNKIVAAKLKREGVRAGVPDIMLPCPSKTFSGLAIEFKRPGNTTTEKQDSYIDLLVEAGWFVVICTDAAAAIQTVRDYLG
jgi:hypothetical protein